MTTLTTASIRLELLEDTLLVQQDLTARLTVLALDASEHPERSPKVRALLAYLLDAVECCEEDLGTCWCRLPFDLIPNCNGILCLQGKANCHIKAPQLY